MRVYLGDGNEVEVKLDDVYFDSLDFEELVKEYTDDILDELTKWDKRERLYVELLRRGIVVKNKDAEGAYKGYLNSLRDAIREIAQYQEYAERAKDLEQKLEELSALLNNAEVDSSEIKAKVSYIESGIAHVNFQLLLSGFTKAIAKLTQPLAEALKNMPNQSTTKN